MHSAEVAQRLRVLIIDDDGRTVHAVRQALNERAGECTLASSASQALARLKDQPFDVVVVAISLPGGTSGLEVLRWVRSQQVPAEVIVLTAQPSVDTAIQALREGAADYLAKPVTSDVIVNALDRIAARLQAARERREALNLLEAGLRHFTSHGVATVPASSIVAEGASDRRFRIGPVLLDMDRFAIDVNGRGVPATPSEIEILHYLCRHPGRVVTAQEIVEAIRGYIVDAREAAEILRPHISNLRRKLLDAEAQADIVRTVRGVGYMLKHPQEKDS